MYFKLFKYSDYILRAFSDDARKRARPPKSFTKKQATADATTLSATAIAVADDRSVQPHHYNGTTCQSRLPGNAHNYQ
jgi:hypothetical protein